MMILVFDFRDHSRYYLNQHLYVLRIDVFNLFLLPITYHTYRALFAFHKAILYAMMLSIMHLILNAA